MERKIKQEFWRFTASFGKPDVRTILNQTIEEENWTEKEEHQNLNLALAILRDLKSNPCFFKELQKKKSRIILKEKKKTDSSDTESGHERNYINFFTTVMNRDFFNFTKTRWVKSNKFCYILDANWTVFIKFLTKG